VEGYRRLGDELALRRAARVVVGWGPGEEPLARAIAHGLRTPPWVPPPTSIPELVALLRRSALVVGGDTGPIHVAAALGVPTVGLYGPTSGRRNGPFGPRTTWVESPTGRMEDIPVSAVLRAAESLAS
jgi:ADP-heptose:LPS heptosyltransferase